MISGNLYIVATPIGNLGDISNRAIETLKQVSVVAAEDTRHTKKLLNHYNIHSSLESYHKFNERKKAKKLIRLLKKGEDIAIVSNAGTPGISDPGTLMVQESIRNDINVIPIPGPTAFVSALIVSGLPTEKFVFEGFLPKKQSQRAKKLISLKSEQRTIIFYETGRKLQNSLVEIENILGNRKCAVAKELTKKYEKIIRGYASDVLLELPQEQIKGEFAIVIKGISDKIKTPDLPLEQEVKKAQAELNITAKDAIAFVAAEYNIPKKKVYRSWVKRKQ